MLRATLLEQRVTNWLTAIPYIEFAINSTISASTGKSPFELLYGENVVLPMDHALHAATPLSHAANFTTHIQNLVQQAQESMAKAQNY